MRDGDRDRLANVETVRFCKARVRIVMKERSVLSALIEVLDGGWEFTISVVVVGEEDIRRGREMGESTRQEFEPHSWIGGRKRVEEASSTAVGRSIEGAVGRMKKELVKWLKLLLWGHVAREDRQWGTIGPNLPRHSV